jgi:hypothetical protein
MRVKAIGKVRMLTKVKAFIKVLMKVQLLM